MRHVTHVTATACFMGTSGFNLAVIHFAVRILHKKTFFETFLIFLTIWCILSLFFKLFSGVKYFKKSPLIDSLNLKTVGKERLVCEKLKDDSLITFTCSGKTIITINNIAQIMSGDYG